MLKKISPAAQEVATSKLRDKEYRLADDRSGLASIIKVGKNRNLLVFDSETGYQRAIRHCPNEKSIFTDEQSEYALVEPIIFMHGYLKVDATDVVTQKFLDAHPDNVSNGGNWFEEINEEKEAKETLEIEELKMDIRNAIRDKAKEDGGMYELEAVVAVLEDSVVTASQMGVESLKRRLYQEVESNPYYFLDDRGNVNIFNDEVIGRKYIVLRAIKDGIIKKSPNNKTMVWVRDNSTIASAPVGIELVQYFADFLSTEEGMLVGEEIRRRS